MKKELFGCAAGVGLLLSTAVPSFAGQWLSSWAANDILKSRESARDVSLRREATASYLTRNESMRVQKVYAVREAQETRELANYEKFKFDQKLALVEARAARRYTVVNNPSNGDAPAETSSTTSPEGVPGDSRSPGFHPVNKYSLPGNSLNAPTGNFSFGAGDSGAAERVRNAPARMFARQARESTADSAEAAQQVRDAAAAAATESSATTTTTINSSTDPSPRRDYYDNSGWGGGRYIDTRGGYRGGQLVRDPYTGQLYRIP